jgi:hypothetical protein
MALWGTDNLYLSHLAMFGPAVHRFQVILEAELARPDGSPVTEYAADRAAHPDQELYSVHPDDFVLPDIFPGSDGPPRRSTLRGALFRNRSDGLRIRVGGQNVRGVPIAEEVVVNIKNVVHARKFDLNAPKPKDLQYIVFGKPGEIYLAHLITRSPDFDQIIRVSIDAELPGESLGRGPVLTIPSRRNDKNQRLTGGGGKVSATLRGPGSTEKAVELEPLEEIFSNDDPEDFG